MKKIIFLLIAIASVSYVDGQAVKSKIRIYQTWVYTDTASRPVKGALYFVSDSSIIIGQSLSKSDYIDGSTTFSEFKYSDIKNIKYRNKGDIIVGSAVGIGVGILTTAIIWNKPVSDPGTPPAILLFEQAAYLQSTLEIPPKQTPLDRDKLTPPLRMKVTPLLRSKLTPVFLI